MISDQIRWTSQLPRIGGLGRLALATGAIILVMGCAGPANRQVDSLPPPIPVGQSSDLAGARVEQARAIAMGLARSRGWSIDQASADQLTLSRRLPPGTDISGLLGDSGFQPDNNADKPNLVRPTAIQVQVHLVPSSRLRVSLRRPAHTEAASMAFPTAPLWSSQQAGTRVILQASLLGLDAEGAPMRQELTQAFENELSISLSALQSAWLESREKILSDIPIPDALSLPDTSPSAESPSDPPTQRPPSSS